MPANLYAVLLYTILFMRLKFLERRIYFINTILQIFVSFTLYVFHVVKYEKDHVERKVPKYGNHKIGERKVKTLTRN